MIKKNYNKYLIIFEIVFMILLMPCIKVYSAPNSGVEASKGNSSSVESSNSSNSNESHENGFIDVDQIKEGQTIDIQIEGDASDPEKPLLKLIKNENGTGLLDILQKVGYLLLILGLGQIIMAFKDDNADAKTRGSMVVMAALFLIVLPLVMNTLFSTAGTSNNWLPDI